MKLVKMLQKAYAGEIAAYYAYSGHWQSEKDPEVRRQIQEIQKHELYHILEIERMLKSLDAKPAPIRTWIFERIGRTIGFLCLFFSQRTKARVAMSIERFGAAKYDDIKLEASRQKRYAMARELSHMAQTEDGHAESLEAL